MRAGKIFVTDLLEMGLLDKVRTLKVGLHMTPQAVMMGLEGSDPETIETSTLSTRYDAILAAKHLQLNGTHSIKYDMDKDMIWRVEPLATHPNGMRFSVYDEEGDLIAVNEYFSVGGGFVVNEQTQVDENLYYRSTNKDDASTARRDQTHGLESKALAAPGEEPTEKPKEKKTDKMKQPPYLFRNAQGLLMMTQQHNLTIAQLVWNNERSYMSSQEISDSLLKIWGVMDQCIHDGVTSTEERLPGRLGVRRRAAGLYRRLFKVQDGFSSEAPPEAFVRGKVASRAPLVVGDFEHDLPVVPWKNTVFPGIDFLSAYAIAVNEVNASGGRVVTAPTNGAAGVIPAVLKYVLEFISDAPERDVKTFLLTAAAIGMLYKRGSTISAAEGGCMAEVGVASSMAAAGFAACLGGTPSQILQAAEIGIEHSLGLTCDPIDGLVQVPCIERNSLGAVKAVTAAQLALAGDGIHSVSLDEAIEAMRVTARGPRWNVAPGTILKTRTVQAAYINVVPVPLRTYQLLYRTTDSQEQPLVTVTTIVVPPGASPEKLVLFGTPEDSAASMCAPSYSIQFAASLANLELSFIGDEAQIAALLAQGWIVTFPDHGGPASAFAAGRQEGKAMLDGRGNRNRMGRVIEGHLAYPDYKEALEAAATPKMLALMADNVNHCLVDVPASFVDFFGTNEYFHEGAATLEIPAIKAVLEETRLGLNETLTPTMPLHVIHAISDELIPYAQAQSMVAEYCSNGANLEFITNPLPFIQHFGLDELSIPTAIKFLSDRLDGVPFHKGCVYTRSNF
ncbi:hypothetical protein RQP46_011178 [Phenoliferia psychrophenolica]